MKDRLSYLFRAQTCRADERLPSVTALQSLFIPPRSYLLNGKKKMILILDLDLNTFRGDLSRNALCKMLKLASKYPGHFSA